MSGPHIFAENAARYWAQGLPVIPLLPGQKRPAPNGWQVYAERMPTPDEQAAWLKVYGGGNMGLPLGPQSGLIAIDIDTDDPKVLAVLDALLPPSPWERVGKKGMVRIYRYRNEKTARLQSSHQMICEILSKGTQVVMPPSIHPDTGRPYHANCDLLEVLDRVPPLPVGFEENLRIALHGIGIEVGNTAVGKVTEFIPAGQRDNKMVWHAGLLARAVTRGERSLLEALGEMEHWVDTYVQNVVGDPLPVEKAQAKVVEFLVRDVTGVRNAGLPVGWDDGLSDEDKKKLGIDFTEENEVWDVDRILDFLRGEFDRFQDRGGAGQMAAVDTALRRMARSDNRLSTLDEERILKFITTQTLNAVPLSALRKGLREMRRGDIEGENHDEIAREVAKHLNEYGEVRFHAGKFWQWAGSHWAEKPESDILRVVSNEFGFYPACRRTNDYVGIVKLLRSIVAKDLCLVGLKGVNFANGFLTERLDLLPHDPDYGATYVLPYRYMPDEAGKMPQFNQFLVTSWGHDPDYEDKVMALQEAMGVTLFGEAPKYQRAICLFGQAGSGKSVANQIMRGLLPQESISAVPPQDWSDRFLPAELYGKVMNFAGELSEKRQIPGEVFKQVVEGEQITAQHKNQDPFKFRPQCAQWFNSNHLPKTQDTSSGFTRRWLFLHWNRPVRAENVVVGLAELITAQEREAIAAWAVQGFARMQEQSDYTFPTSHLALSDQMAVDNNSVRYFLASCPLIIVGKTKTAGCSSPEISSKELYDEYWAFGIATGVAKRAPSQTFVRLMRELESSFDFTTENRQTHFGGQEIVFNGITLAKAA